MEIIKTAIKVGNSAGVLLPREYLNYQVKVTLEPLNIEKEIIKILLEENLLEEIIGAYLIGSYVRKEQTIESDIDILIITSSINKRITKDKYEIICISKKEVERQLKENALPILQMLKEAKPVINKELLKSYINHPLTKKNIKWHIDTTKSAIKVIKKDIEISKELNEKNIDDRIVYSLILRLRTMYIIKCIKNNKVYKKTEFLKLVKKIAGSLRAYEGYIRSKTNQKPKQTLPIPEAEKLVNRLSKKIIQIEKWLKEKKD